MYNRLRHVVVIGLQQNSLLFPRCEANFNCMLPELWFIVAQITDTEDSCTVLSHKPWHNTQQESFFLMLFQMNGWQDNAACIRWKQYGTSPPVCECTGTVHVRFPVGYACACIRTISLCESKRMLSLSLQLSDCQAAFNTWISRSPPHAHLPLHTQLISIPLQWEKLCSC